MTAGNVHANLTKSDPLGERNTYTFGEFALSLAFLRGCVVCMGHLHKVAEHIVRGNSKVMGPGHPRPSFLKRENKMNHVNMKYRFAWLEGASVVSRGILVPAAVVAPALHGSVKELRCLCADLHSVDVFAQQASMGIWCKTGPPKLWSYRS